MKKDVIGFWVFISACALIIAALAFGSDTHASVTDERGCQIQSYSDNRIFGEDTHTVQTYCPVEVKND